MYTQSIARWAAGTCDAAALPAEIQSATRRCLLDYLSYVEAGLANAGPRLAKVTPLRDGWSEPDRVAFVLGTAAHSMECDDFHRQARLHPGVVIFSTLLPFALREGVTLDGLLRAAAVGYEVSIRLGEAAAPEQTDRGFHPTATCGVIGAAVAASVLLRHSEAQIASVIGIAASFSSGLRVWRADGAETKILQVGRASESAGLAVRLAEQGFTGSSVALEGDLGWFQAYGGTPGDPDSWGVPRRVAEVSFKPWPSCRYTHTAIQAAEQLRPDFLRDPRPVRVGVSKELYRSVMAPEDRKASPRTKQDAQFSIPYTMAVMLLSGDVSVADFEGQRRTDPEVTRVAADITGYVHEGAEASFPVTNTVVVDMPGAPTIIVDYPKGDPEAPLADADLDAKAHRLMGPYAAPAEIQSVIDSTAAGVCTPEWPVAMYLQRALDRHVGTAQ